MVPYLPATTNRKTIQQTNYKIALKDPSFVPSVHYGLETYLVSVPNVGSFVRENQQKMQESALKPSKGSANDSEILAILEFLWAL